MSEFHKTKKDRNALLTLSVKSAKVCPSTRGGAVMFKRFAARYRYYYYFEE